MLSGYRASARRVTVRICPDRPEGNGMPDPTVEFFERLERLGHAPTLNQFTGTLRFDLGEGDRVEHWYLAISRGDITVSHDDREADCMITGERALFDDLARGRLSPLCAWLRNQFAVKGRFRPLLLLGRLLPEQPDAHDPRDLVGRDGRRR
jgi:hypothetical protein